MKNLKSILLSSLLRLFISTGIYSQEAATANHTIVISVPEVALLDIEGGTSINMGPDAPTEAGSPLVFSGNANTSLWLNYSSIVGTTVDATRNVTVSISNGTIPGGMELKVTAGADAGAGAGTMGTSAGLITLSGTSQTIISGIGSSYTGDGVSKGHNLTYELSLASGSYGDIDFEDDNTLTILYTITNN